MALSIRTAGYIYSRGTAFSQQALTGVSFEVAPGDLVLVIGSTGSGKSTLLRLMAGLTEPSEGSLWIDGTPLDLSSARGTVGLVFQDPESQLFADTVCDDVMFGPRNLGFSVADARTATESALLAVGLEVEQFGERSPFTLSGGESRRVAIAGVLAMSPRYLLLDEPTAGLDAGGRHAIRRLVHNIRRRAGVVIVSHSAEEFLEDATAVLVLAAGAPVFLGTPEALVSDPAVLAIAGLDAPEVLRAQWLARDRGADLKAPLTVDPLRAARNMAEAGGWA